MMVERNFSEETPAVSDTPQSVAVENEQTLAEAPEEELVELTAPDTLDPPEAQEPPIAPDVEQMKRDLEGVKPKKDSSGRELAKIVDPESGRQWSEPLDYVKGAKMLYKGSKTPLSVFEKYYFGITRLLQNTADQPAYNKFYGMFPNMDAVMLTLKDLEAYSEDREKATDVSATWHGQNLWAGTLIRGLANSAVLASEPPEHAHEVSKARRVDIDVEFGGGGPGLGPIPYLQRFSYNKDLSLEDLALASFEKGLDIGLPLVQDFAMAFATGGAYLAKAPWLASFLSPGRRIIFSSAFRQSFDKYADLQSLKEASGNENINPVKYAAIEFLVSAGLGIVTDKIGRMAMTKLLGFGGLLTNIDDSFGKKIVNGTGQAVENVFDAYTSNEVTKRAYKDEGLPYGDLTPLDYSITAAVSGLLGMRVNSPMMDLSGPEFKNKFKEHLKSNLKSDRIKLNGDSKSSSVDEVIDTVVDMYYDGYFKEGRPPVHSELTSMIEMVANDVKAVDRLELVTLFENHYADELVKKSLTTNLQGKVKSSLIETIKEDYRKNNGAEISDRSLSTKLNEDIKDDKKVVSTFYKNIFDNMSKEEAIKEVDSMEMESLYVRDSMKRSIEDAYSKTEDTATKAEEAAEQTLAANRDAVKLSVLSNSHAAANNAVNGELGAFKDHIESIMEGGLRTKENGAVEISSNLYEKAITFYAETLNRTAKTYKMANASEGAEYNKTFHENDNIFRAAIKKNIDRIIDLDAGDLALIGSGMLRNVEDNINLIYDTTYNPNLKVGAERMLDTYKMANVASINRIKFGLHSLKEISRLAKDLGADTVKGKAYMDIVTDLQKVNKQMTIVEGTSGDRVIKYVKEAAEASGATVDDIRLIQTVANDLAFINKNVVDAVDLGKPVDVNGIMYKHYNSNLDKRASGSYEGNSYIPVAWNSKGVEYLRSKNPKEFQDLDSSGSVNKYKAREVGSHRHDQSLRKDLFEELADHYAWEGHHKLMQQPMDKALSRFKLDAFGPQYRSEKSKADRGSMIITRAELKKLAGADPLARYMYDLEGTYQNQISKEGRTFTELLANKEFVQFGVKALGRGVGFVAKKKGKYVLSIGNVVFTVANPFPHFFSNFDLKMTEAVSPAGTKRRVKQAYDFMVKYRADQAAFIQNMEAKGALSINKLESATARYVKNFLPLESDRLFGFSSPEELGDSFKKIAKDNFEDTGVAKKVAGSAMLVNRGIDTVLEASRMLNRKTEITAAIDGYQSLYVFASDVIRKKLWDAKNVDHAILKRDELISQLGIIEGLRGSSRRKLISLFDDSMTKYKDFRADAKNKDVSMEASGVFDDFFAKYAEVTAQVNVPTMGALNDAKMIAGLKLLGDDAGSVMAAFMKYVTLERGAARRFMRRLADVKADKQGANLLLKAGSVGTAYLLMTILQDQSEKSDPTEKTVSRAARAVKGRLPIVNSLGFIYGAATDPGSYAASVWSDLATVYKIIETYPQSTNEEYLQHKRAMEKLGRSYDLERLAKIPSPLQLEVATDKTVDVVTNHYNEVMRILKKYTTGNAQHPADRMHNGLKNLGDEVLRRGVGDLDTTERRGIDIETERRGVDVDDTLQRKGVDLD